ncbi:GIY-YIG nuclease family protein [Frondihabitans cladoniiphilus]|uniref:GIY-YIG catalytic domain-containing protein n=1 Tax=Frondihabitans cladoniiphilus TaxID=715785 RepID=A0ABP8W2E4_9MICO
MTPDELAELTADAVSSLGGQSLRIVDAATSVESKPGLYAIWADQLTWRELGIEWRGASFPLYVGKSESSLLGREVNTHFDAGSSSASKTGSSTVRRSFAALLASSLDLQGIPRNVEKPGYFSTYSIRPADDARLTAWMHEHLSLSIWGYPTTAAVLLDLVETEVIRAWDPPINIQKVPSSRAELKAARSLLARQAAAWTPISWGLTSPSWQPLLRLSLPSSSQSGAASLRAEA